MPDSSQSAFSLPEAKAVLERTPSTLRAMLTGLPESWLESTEGGDTWSPRQVVGHLADLEEHDWMPRARIILAQGLERRFQPVDRFRHLRTSEGKTLEELLERFETLRMQNLRDLDAMHITPDQLEWEGEHPALGPTKLRQLLSTWVVHDLTHLYQIVRTMAGRYREDVGPWVAYLSVLTR